MKKLVCIAVVGCALAGAAQVGAKEVGRPNMGQALLLDARGQLVALDELGQRLYYVRPASLKLLQTVELDGHPFAAVEGKSGALYVSLRDRGEVLVLAKGEAPMRIAVGPEPRGLALSLDQRTLWVVLAGDNRLVSFALPSGKRLREVALAPLARSVAVGNDALWVGHLDDSVTMLSGKGLGITTRGTVGGTVYLRDEGLGATGMAPPDAYYGGARPTLAPPPALYTDGRPAALPRSAAFCDSMLAIGDDGTRTVSINNGLQIMSAPAPEGVRALVCTSSGLLALSSFSPRIYRYSIEHEGLRHAATALLPVPAAERARMAQIDRGRKLFHDATDPRIAADRVACASCHPDGLSDGRVWTVDGGQRRTPTLAARLAGSAPYRWDGSRPSLHDSMATTIERLGGAGLPDAELADLEAYMLTMTLPARDASRDDAALIAEGRALFDSALCTGCHIPAQGYQDGKLHDIGGATLANATGQSFDTPSLIGVRMGGPYFHDGSAPTLDAVLEQANSGTRHMGDTASLSAKQRKALVAFLQTL